MKLNFIYTFVMLLTLAACKNTANFDTKNIPLDACIEGNINTIPSLEDRQQYCKCLVKKLTSKERLKKQFAEDLKKGNINKVLQIVQGNQSFAYLRIEDCLKSVQMAWTKGIADGLLKNWKTDLLKNGFDKEHNINLYCNCLLSEYKHYSLNKVLEPDFSNSRVGKAISENCKLKAKY